MTHNAYSANESSYQKHKESIPHPVLPLLPTPVMAASWGVRLHRRVQTLQLQICGNLFERSAESAK
ncbi:hypothetical protein [Comamonas testosteroni]|uniref:hypothetical protein n=1 Tax=Comamonas testosteroni TaxID=285 RepID=UPI001EE73538|nr:hypothetical protein [Comamonas testosteroni]